MKIITKEEFMKKTVSAGVSAEAFGGTETLPDMSNYGGVKFNCGCGSKHKIKETRATTYIPKKHYIILCPDLTCMNYVKFNFFSTETIFASDKC